MGTIEQIKKNLIAKEKIENDADHPQKMRDAKPSVLASLFHTFGGGCINDGIYISYLIMEFYGFDVSKFLCYQCQEQKKQEAVEDQYPPAEEMVYSKEQNEEVLRNYQIK